MKKLSKTTIVFAGIFFLCLATLHAQNAIEKSGLKISKSLSVDQKVETTQGSPTIPGQRALGKSGESTLRTTTIDLEMPTMPDHIQTQNTTIDPQAGAIVGGDETSPVNSFQQTSSNMLTGREVLLDEGFESWEPEGWSFYQLGIQWVGWQQSAVMPHTGEYSASHAYYAGGVHDNWMVTPQLTIDEEYNFVFWDRFTDYDYYEYSGVHISTGSGDPTSGDFVEIYNATNATPEIWVEHIFDLSAYIGQDIYIAFQYSGDNAHKWYVDDVRVNPLTFIDGAISAIINPVPGTTTTGGSTEDVTIELTNVGTDIISDANIEWMVNGEVQTTFSASNLNLGTEESVELMIGQYDFSAYIEYDISVTCVIDDDQNPANDNMTGIYIVDDLGNAGVTAIYPFGDIAAAIVQDVTVTIKNFGVQVLESVEVEWEIDGVAQQPYIASNLGLAPNTSIEQTIGQYDFSTPGIYDIFAGTNLPIDYVPSNDTMSVVFASGILLEGFEGPHNKFWPPDHWISLNASPLTDWPYQGDYMGHILSGASEFGATDGWFATPLLDISPDDFINFFLSFDLASGGGFSVNWMDGQTGEVHFIQSVTVTPGEWEEKTIDISAATGINRIVFLVHSDAYVESFLDNVTCSAPTYTYDYDLELLRFDQNWTPFTNVESIIKCSVRNYTANPVAAGAYTIKLMEEPGIELGSVSGVALAAMETMEYQFNYTFTDEEQHNLYFELDYASEQNPDDNISNIVSVYPVPEATAFVEIGEAEQINLNIPFDTYGTEGLGEDDFTQIIYQFDEVGTLGYIHGFKFHYSLYALIYGQELPLTVWIGETLNDDLSGGWEPMENLTLVFDSLVITKNYQDEMFIPFDSPYLYTGGNIVIQIIQHDPSFPASWTSFVTTFTPGELRTAKSPDWYEIDPWDPPSFEFETQHWEEIPDITFVVNPFEDLAEVSGTVYDENSEPLANAFVELAGTAVSSHTDNQGNYLLPIIPYGEWTFSASYLGYEDNIQTITVDEEAEILDFTMIPKPLVTLSGYVEGTEQPGSSLEGVSISIAGYNSYSGTTGTNGIFSIEYVFGNADYELHVSKFGYESYTETFSLMDENLDFGTIILQERVISAFDVSAMENPDDEIAEIYWPDPLTGMEDTLQFDTGDESYGLANEPGEHVWLGNLMSNNEVITITSVTVFFIDNPQTPGLVSMDIFDIDENLLVSSENFYTQNDTYLTIDFPNLTYDADLYIMLHWKNTPETTNMLGIDFTPGITDRCYIHYPEEGFVLLSEFIGTTAGVALIRANVLKDSGNKDGDDSKAVSSYNLYRGVSDDFYNIGNWTLVNSEPVTDLEYVDAGWLDTEPNNYRYAVEAIYVEGTAEVTYSNILSIDFVAPTNLVVIPDNNNGSAMFSWESPQHNVQSYQVYLDDMNTPVATVTDPQYNFTNLGTGQYTAGVRAVYNTGESAIETEMFDLTVGIDENPQQAIKVYPNPASDYIMVSNSKDASFKICDLAGRPVMEKTVVDDNQRIDISSLKQGMYLLIISNGEISFNRKLEIFR